MRRVSAEKEQQPGARAQNRFTIVEFKDIKSIVDLMKKNSISDFEMEKEGFKIKLRRTDGTKTDDVQVQHYLPPASAAPVPMPVCMHRQRTKPGARACYLRATRNLYL